MEERVLYGFWLSPYMCQVAQLLGESGLDYRYERVSPYLGATHAEEHKSRNRLGKIPCLQEPGGTIISESQAICRYVARTQEAARVFYPADDAKACARVDELNDFITFSISGPFFSCFVGGCYFPQAFRLNMAEEAKPFIQISLFLVMGSLKRLMAGASLSPFLMGDKPKLPDFQLFYILELGRLFSGIFNIPNMNLMAGDPDLQAFYAAMSEREVTANILQNIQNEMAVNEHELFNEFGKAYAGSFEKGRQALERLFGHPV